MFPQNCPSLCTDRVESVNSFLFDVVYVVLEALRCVVVDFMDFSGVFVWNSLVI